MWINRIHQRNVSLGCKRFDDSHAIVEVPGYLNDFGAMHHGLGQLSLRDLTIWNHNKRLNAGSRRISGGRGGCVASRSADNSSCPCP